MLAVITKYYRGQTIATCGQYKKYFNYNPDGNEDELTHHIRCAKETKDEYQKISSAEVNAICQIGKYVGNARMPGKTQNHWIHFFEVNGN